jgi:hypothetical protein
MLLFSSDGEASVEFDLPLPVPDSDICCAFSFLFLFFYFVCFVGMCVRVYRMHSNSYVFFV